tara:strand:+ start:245 stop:454 length:210 start_codon:yes stop_codon:yes gene_type:complete
METEKTRIPADAEDKKKKRTVKIEGGIEVTIHAAHDLDNLPVTKQELDLLLTYLGPLIEPLLQKEKQKR